jgi:hypothetical protein
MPRYFFNLRNSTSTNDEEGRILPDIEAARIAARANAINMAAVSVLEERLFNPRHHIEVTDEAGEVLFTVSFGEVVKVET